MTLQGSSGGEDHLQSLRGTLSELMMEKTIMRNSPRALTGARHPAIPCGSCSEPGFKAPNITLGLAWPSLPIT